MQAWCFEGVGEATSALSEATASPPVNSRFSCRWFYHKVNFQSWWVWALFWKQMPSGTFISEGKRKVLGLNTSEDKANTAFSWQQKCLLVHHSRSPRALRYRWRGHSLLHGVRILYVKKETPSYEVSLTKDDALDGLLELSVTSICVVFWLLYIFIVAFTIKKKALTHTSWC